MPNGNHREQFLIQPDVSSSDMIAVINADFAVKIRNNILAFAQFMSKLPNLLKVTALECRYDRKLTIEYRSDRPMASLEGIPIATD